jgi:hypothetical protein
VFSGSRSGIAGSLGDWGLVVIERQAMGGTRGKIRGGGSRATLGIIVGFAHVSARHPGWEVEVTSPGLSRAGFGVGWVIGPVRAIDFHPAGGRSTMALHSGTAEARAVRRGVRW